jgi:hypothetical protein
MDGRLTAEVDRFCREGNATPAYLLDYGAHPIESREFPSVPLRTDHGPGNWQV